MGIYFRDILLNKSFIEVSNNLPIILLLGANNCGQHEQEKAFISQWDPPPHTLFLKNIYFLKNFFLYIYIFEGIVTKKQNTKFKQQGIQVDQLYIYSVI